MIIKKQLFEDFSKDADSKELADFYDKLNDGFMESMHYVKNSFSGSNITTEPKIQSWIKDKIIETFEIVAVNQLLEDNQELGLDKEAIKNKYRERLDEITIHPLDLMFPEDQIKYLTEGNLANIDKAQNTKNEQSVKATPSNIINKIIDYFSAKDNERQI